jgi:hypothetical protein
MSLAVIARSNPVTADTGGDRSVATTELAKATTAADTTFGE